jgi:hypothetical protein
MLLGGSINIIVTRFYLLEFSLEEFYAEDAFKSKSRPGIHVGTHYHSY